MRKRVQGTTDRESECWSPILPEETNEERVLVSCGSPAWWAKLGSLSNTTPIKQSGPSSSSLIGPVSIQPWTPILVGTGVTSPGTPSSAVCIRECSSSLATLQCVCPPFWYTRAIYPSSPAETYLDGDYDPGRPVVHEQYRHRACSRSSWGNTLLSGCEKTVNTKETTVIYSINYLIKLLN